MHIDTYKQREMEIELEIERETEHRWIGCLSLHADFMRETFKFYAIIRTCSRAGYRIK